MAVKITVAEENGRNEIKVYDAVSDKRGEAWVNKHFEAWIKKREEMRDPVEHLKNPPTLYSQKDLRKFLQYGEEMDRVQQSKQSNKKKRWLF